MVSTISKKSLTFYQPTSVKSNSVLTSSHSGGIASASIGGVANTAITTTNQFNNQLNGFLLELGIEKNKLAQRVSQNLANNADYQAARSSGVNLAWDYEAADIKMGGNGSGQWTYAERKQILKNRPDIINKTKTVDGKQVNPKAGVRGAEGHHQKNVADHPEYQADPDNIKFYRNREEHRVKGHKGDFHNETDSPMIDKNKMLKHTNKKRVFKNEMKGIGIAVGIGLGIGFTIGFAVSLAQSGVSPEGIKLAFIEGGKSGFESGVMAGVGYGIGRTIGEVATKAMVGLLNNLGVNITENITKMCNMGAVGALTIAVFTTYQFIKLKRAGVATRDALLIVGKQALFSLTLLAVSIAAQGIWGGPAGIIVSVSIGIIMITYSVVDILHQKAFSDVVRVYMIEHCRPLY